MKSISLMEYYLLVKLFYIVTCDSKIETIIDLLNSTSFLQRLALNLLKTNRKQMKQAYLLLIIWLLVNYRLNKPCCHDESVLVEPTNEHTASQLKEEIVDGRYNIGQLILPQSYEKLF